MKQNGNKLAFSVSNNSDFKLKLKPGLEGLRESDFWTFFGVRTPKKMSESGLQSGVLPTLFETHLKMKH